MGIPFDVIVLMNSIDHLLIKDVIMLMNSFRPFADERVIVQ